MKKGENEVALPLITRARAEFAVPLEDCSGRKYSKDEREDIIRYLILGAEIQRDTDFRMDTWDRRIKLNQKIGEWLGEFIVLYYEEEGLSDIKNKLLKDRLLFRDFGVFIADRIKKENKE